MAFPSAVARKVLDSLVDEIAVIDRDGAIVYVNAAWVAFASANGIPGSTRWRGVNYVAACRAAVAAGDGTATPVIRGFDDVFAGRATWFQHEPLRRS